MSSSRYQTLNMDLTDRAVSLTARGNSNGPSGLHYLMPVASSICRQSAKDMLGVLYAILAKSATLGA